MPQNQPLTLNEASKPPVIFTVNKPRGRKSRPLFFIWVFTVLLFLSQATRMHAQILLFCSIPCVVDDEDGESTEAEKVVDATKQFTTQLDIARTAISSYNASVSIYSATLTTSKTASDIYGLTLSTDTAPTNDYVGYSANGVNQWVPVVQPSNTYSNAQQWFEAKASGNGANGATQAVTVKSTGVLSGYLSLRPDGQRALSSVGAAIDVNDAVNTTALQTLGTVRSNAGQREVDIATLEAAVQSGDGSQQTLMAALHRANQAVLLKLRAQQDGLQLQQASNMVRLSREMETQNQRKMAMQAADQYEINFRRYMTSTPLQVTGSTSH